MRNDSLNLENANAEVLKWLDNRANKQIHSTTLQQVQVEDDLNCSNGRK